MQKIALIFLIFLTAPTYIAAFADAPVDTTRVADAEDTDDVDDFDEILDEIVIVKRQNGRRKSRSTAENAEIISSAELMRAACCNLGESFSTNPSVDVNYSDAATGARQIKLLGLSGTYVQMLTENIPNLRGAASAYGLGYIPGPWMQSIQVSKGASSVKNGYESITGQINIEYLKPQAEPSLAVNGYADMFGKAEINASGNLHIGQRWSSGLLIHGENAFAGHDDNNDGFIDLPRVRQFNAMNRWAYMGNKYVFQAGVRFLAENRRSGSHSHAKDNAATSMGHEPYIIDIDTRRWEAFTKNAYIFDRDNDGSVALILSGSLHDEDADYGHKLYDVRQDNIYASLMFERKWHDGKHALSTGVSVNYDRFDQQLRFENNIATKPSCLVEKETTPGVYAQYTLSIPSGFMIMAGLRYDRSSVYGSMVTPRVHARYNLLDGALSLHASAGRGYRSPHALADNHFYMASARQIIIGSDLQQETAMNYGGGISGFFSLFNRTLNYNADYYYTRFSHQLLVDLDTDPHAVIIRDSQNNRNRSHALQIEITYPVIDDLSLTVAYRLTDVRVDYGNGKGLVTKPLTSRNKGLFSLSWTPNMGLWQTDVTLALNGSGRMPTPYVRTDGSLSWPETYGMFPQLNAQITRNFRHWAIYIGGENLTGFRQKNPIVDAANPWGSNFDATMVYGPIHGPMAYIGFRYRFTKY